jgi:hypothetical protein
VGLLLLANYIYPNTNPSGMRFKFTATLIKKLDDSRWANDHYDRAGTCIDTGWYKESLSNVNILKLCYKDFHFGTPEHGE